MWLFDVTQLGCMRWCSYCTRSRRQGEFVKSSKHQQTVFHAYMRLQRQPVNMQLIILRSWFPPLSPCSYTHSFSFSHALRQYCTHARWWIDTFHLISQVYGRHGGIFDSKALMGHHFFVIRAIAGSEKESGEEIQDRLTKEFFETIEDYVA